MAAHEQPLRVAFYEFRMGEVSQSLGGTGIEFASLLNFLEHQPTIHLTTIACTPAPQLGRGRWGKLKAFLLAQWLDVKRVLAPDEDVLLFVYPKVPFLGHSEFTIVRLLALACFGLLALKRRLTGQRIVVLITDLPQEQRAMTEAADSRQALAAQLDRFCARRGMVWRDRVERAVEGLLFRTAQDVVSLSPLMTQHIIRKHRLPQSKICLRGRNAYAPAHAGKLPAIDLHPANGLRVFYSGGLDTPSVKGALRRIMPLFREFPESHLYVAGRNGGWVQGEAQAAAPDNVRYLGALDYASHDAVARQCDLGLILYSAAYCHLVLTSKYSAYVANGLAVLSSDMISLAEILAEDGVGLCVPAEQMPAQLAAWLNAPHLIAPYRERARQLRGRYWTGIYFQKWFSEVIAG